VALETERWKWLQAIASERGPADPTTRHVLMTLSLHMNQRGEQAFPSQRLLARRTGLSERSVRTHLQLAREAGWILVYAKQPKGHGWRLHEYVAAVPENLEDLPDAIWETDPSFLREEPVSARDRGFEPEPPEGAAVRSARPGRPTAFESSERAASDAGRAANGAHGAANGDATCGTSFHNVGNQLPTNPSGNPSGNPSRSPSEEGALTRTARSKVDLKKVPQEAQSARAERIRKAIAGMPEANDEAIRCCVSGATLEDVRQARSARA
jgi:hypothetical protein